MTWIWPLLALLLLLDALQVRKRVAALAVLAPSDEPVSPDHRFLVGPGATLDDATRRAASAHARAHGIRVLDLIPGDLPAARAWGVFQLLDPERYRADRLGKGRTAGHAILVTTDVLARAGAPETAPDDPVAFVRLAGQLKHYASAATDAAIAPSLHAVPEPRGKRLAALREVIGMGATAVVVGVPVMLALIVTAAATNRVTGWLPIVAFHLQPLLAFAGGRFRPRALAATALLRTPIELWIWLGLTLEPRGGAAAEAANARRKEYDALVTGGLDRFFEPRIDRCPVCGGGSLAVRLRTVDLLQHKPGRFTLERCEGCDHIFQNPRLSIEGLDYYYRDFYDGLGADELEDIFGAQEVSYLARARTVADHGGGKGPGRWLDVGGGHGHFCEIARGVLPKTRFDALDLSESIEEGTKRGWVDACYRGLFPDLAPKLAGAYDVVSMSHYLEHTRDPRAELAAAREALAPGGLLLIEVPDPAFVLGTVLGRLWLPWFQPQHQHLLSVENLTRLLGEAGFSLVVTHRGEAHQRVDFFAAVYLFLDWLAPAVDRPWLPPTGAGARALRTLVFTLGTPALVGGHVVDAILFPYFRRAKASNTYRVVAKKTEAPTAAAP